MKVNDSNLTSPATTGNSPGVAGTQQTDRTNSFPRSGNGVSGGAAPSDDVHLSELVRSLRSLAADAPERQAKIEALARTYAKGAYTIDAEGTASRIIDDATRS